jgi:hypothetical protein
VSNETGHHVALLALGAHQRLRVPHALHQLRVPRLLFKFLRGDLLPLRLQVFVASLALLHVAGPCLLHRSLLVACCARVVLRELRPLLPVEETTAREPFRQLFESRGNP